MSEAYFFSIGYSKAQARIMEKLMYGYSNKKIAGELALSERTVKFHLTKIYKQSAVTSRLQLMRKIMAERGQN